MARKKESVFSCKPRVEVELVVILLAFGDPEGDNPILLLIDSRKGSRHEDDKSFAVLLFPAPRGISGFGRRAETGRKDRYPETDRRQIRIGGGSTECHVPGQGDGKKPSQSARG